MEIIHFIAFKIYIKYILFKKMHQQYICNIYKIYILLKHFLNLTAIIRCSKVHLILDLA